MSVIIFALIAFCVVLLLVSQGPDEEILKELNVKAIEEPEIQHKSPLDPYVSEDNVVAKEKRKYKPRKVKVRALVETEEDTIVKPKKKYRARRSII